jgi:hypothetical protein
VAQPDTICVGIDPAARPAQPLAANVKLFTVTSDEFFGRHHLPDVLGRDSFSLAFIDGLHLFEQALRDFIHLERFAGGHSIILLHDCVPLDPVTSARTRSTGFYSGDVWKLTLCLRETRPDLRMVIVPTPPTGLCIVSGLDPASTILEERYDACVARYIDLTFSDYEACVARMPAVIPNTKRAVMSYVAGLRPPVPAAP